MLNGPAGRTDPEHAQARKQFQWKPIAGYLMLALGTSGSISRSRRGGLVEFENTGNQRPGIHFYPFSLTGKTGFPDWRRGQRMQ